MELSRGPSFSSFYNPRLSFFFFPNNQVFCFQKSEKKQNKTKQNFPAGPVVKNLPSNAGDAGLIPGQGTKNPHVAEQLSQCTTRELEPQIERLCITVTESACYN